MARRSAAPAIPVPTFDLSGERTTLFTAAVDSLIRGLSGEAAADGRPVDRDLESAREKCRAGNPLLLIAAQWPELIVRDPAEIAIFRETPPDGRAAGVPQNLIDVAYDPTAPVLRLDWWQRVILAAFFDPSIGEIYIKGCTGAGKGASVGIGFSLLFDVYAEARLILTGRDYSHGVTNIFGEVKQWFQKMKSPAMGRVLGESIDDTERHYIRVLNPSPSSVTAGEAFSGAHGANTIYAFDESSALPSTFFDNAEKNARKIIALSNPRTRFGKFHDAFKPLGPDHIDRIGVVRGATLGNRLCVTVGGPDCLNVRHNRLKRPVAPLGGIEVNGHQYAAGDRIPPEDFAKVGVLVTGQIDLQQFRGILSKDKFQIDVFGHGRFPQEDPEKQVILASWLDPHERAYSADSPPAVEAFGLDVGASAGGDPSCLAAGGAAGLRELIRWQEPDAMKTVAKVLELAQSRYGIDLRQGRHPITVDADGCGFGVAARLRELSCWVYDFHGGVPAVFLPQVYGNLRAEAYALLGRRLDPNDVWSGKPWAMPIDEHLRQELTAPEKIFPRHDLTRFKITPKHRSPDAQDSDKTMSIRDKLHRSPDAGDATAYLWHGLFRLHDYMRYLAVASGPLVAWPAPPAEGPGKNGQPATNGSVSPTPKPPDHPLVEFYKREYGDIDQEGARGVPKPFERPKALPAVEAPVANPEKQDWTSQLKWGDD